MNRPALLLLALMLAGCGQSGDLFIPAEPEQASESGPTGPAETAEEEDDEHDEQKEETGPR